MTKNAPDISHLIDTAWINAASADDEEGLDEYDPELEDDPEFEDYQYPEEDEEEEENYDYYDDDEEDPEYDWLEFSGP